MTNNNPPAKKVAAPQQPTPPAAPTPEPEQKPSVGRIVHYYTDPDGEQRAALISGVDGASVRMLHVLNQHGVAVAFDVSQAPFPTPGCWTWPSRD